jgi:hypothetical protein
VLASRYLGSDPSEERLILRSGESISEDGRLTYSVEYRLTDRWSIMGAWVVMSRLAMFNRLFYSPVTG